MHDFLTLQAVPGSPAQAVPAGPGSQVITQWTGRDIRALRMTNEEFAEHLGIAPRTLSNWNTHPHHVRVPELYRALDTALDRVPAPARERFALALTVGERA
jgi:hypothetical protein